MARINTVIIEPVTFPNMIGMGPISITPPVLTSPVLDAVP
jgi:hypothetical protein